MTTYLLFDDALRSPEMRHEIAEPIMDDIIFIETDGKRIVVASVLEKDIFEARDDLIDEVWNWDDLGARELVKDESVPEWALDPELALRAVKRLGTNEITVPPTFRVQIADHLRKEGIIVTVDPVAWTDRRRQKSPWELEGIERAQRAAETAMLAAQRMLREAERTDDGRLKFEGEILTAEWIREAMTTELLGQGAESEDIIIHSGEACLKGHDLGMGPILADESCIIDCFPRDRRTGTYSDMTRTYVPGTPKPELEKLHTHCRAALEIALESIKPGRDDAHQRVTEYFHSHGFPTWKYHEGKESLSEGFFHSLGHGVGLQVHEKPWIGMKPDAFVERDVVAIEPGLYFPGIGGVRLEDTVVITEDGPRHFTDPFDYDLTP